MALYEFECLLCGKIHESLQGYYAKAPLCDNGHQAEPTKRIISAPARAVITKDCTGAQRNAAS